MKVLALVLATVAIHQAQATAVNRHCAIECKNAVHPSDENERKKLGFFSREACKRFWKRSLEEGKVCSRFLSRSSEISCIEGCIEGKGSSTLASKIREMKAECVKLGNGVMGQYGKLSCQQGIDSGMTFVQTGVLLREKVNEMCGTESVPQDSAIPAERAKAKVVKPEPVKEVKPATPEPVKVVEPEPVKAPEPVEEFQQFESEKETEADQEEGDMPFDEEYEEAEPVLISEIQFDSEGDQRGLRTVSL